MNYNIIGKIALEFRLSLDNVCRLLGKEPDDKTKMEVYDAITSSIWDFKDKDSYDYLFNYETINENHNVSMMSYTKAALFLKKYSQALKENNQETIDSLKKELTKTEAEFNKIKDSGKLTFTAEEITIISKYRLKYCMSKSKMGYILNVSRDVLSNAENKITNILLREKLVKLSEFYEDIAVISRKRK